MHEGERVNRINLVQALIVVAFVSVLALAFNVGAAGEPKQFAAAELPVLAISSPISGLSQPVSITHAGDGSGRIFVVEQGGTIRIIRNGGVVSTPFLNITSRISTGGERGLLGLAFAPGYASNGRFYVNYTNAAGDTVIARYTRNTTNPDLANPASEQIVITIAQPFANHNGGQLAFGKFDGFLYIGMGDGGSAGDPGNRAQDPNNLLGKILRINVEAGLPATYTVPSNNPFVGLTGFRPEIWALGLRNPWRFSFDQLTGDLFVADVGQGAWEEINFQSAASAGGENYGWRIMEGNHCFNPSTGCNTTGLVIPVAEYSHSFGCSVTGGYVYRGSVYPRMQGIYFYGDFCSGRIWGLSGGPSAWQNDLLLDTTLSISTFGEDEVGNLYVANYSGTVFSLIDATPTPTPTPTPTSTPTPTPTPATQVTIQFNVASVEATEGCTSAVINVSRTGPGLSGKTDSVDYSTADGSALQKSDYTFLGGRLIFAPDETAKTLIVPITEDAFAEGDETATLTLSNPSAGATLGAPAQLTLVIKDNETVNGTANPIDDAEHFVCQHYHDFFTRQSDPDGQNFWTSQILACVGDPSCVDNRRQNVSAAFFLSIEFEETGFLVYRFYKSAFGQMPRYQPFLMDTQQVGRDLVVNKAGWEQRLENNTQLFAADFVSRPVFVTQYPLTMTAAQFVDALNANAGGALSPAERDALVARLSSGADTRASALRTIADDDDLKAAEKNRAFVLMQYFGYLRRNPDDPPNTDFSGFDFWLNKLNSHGGNFVSAEMVRAFLISEEYRSRFGPP